MTLLYSVTSFKEDAVPFDEFEGVWEQKSRHIERLMS